MDTEGPGFCDSTVFFFFLGFFFFFFFFSLRVRRSWDLGLSGFYFIFAPVAFKAPTS